MNFSSSGMAWLLPAWILGAPLVAAVINLMTTPKPNPREEASRRDRDGASDMSSARNSTLR